MAVHFGNPQRTVRHSKPYCTCVNGRDCAESKKSPQRPGRRAGRVRNLEARQRDYESSRFSDKEKAARRRPGSTK